MPLNTMDLNVGSGVTTPAVLTTPETLYFKEDGQVVANGIHLVAAGDAFATRRQVIAKVRPAVLDPKTGLYNKDKKSMVFVRPVQIDGKTIFNTIRIEIEVHPLADGDTLPMLKTAGVSMLSDSETVDFWYLGATR